MSPMINIDIVFLTLFAASMTANRTIEAPKLEAIAIAQLERANEAKNPPKILEPRIRTATPKLAPEEIPKTNGPANGFLNNVCINKPLIANPDPTKQAVIAFGSLKFKMIISQLDFELVPPKRRSNTSENGIDTDPELTLTSNNSISTKKSARNCFVYVFC